MQTTTMADYLRWVHTRTLILAPPCGECRGCASPYMGKWWLCVDGQHVCNALTLRKLWDAASAKPATHREGIPYDGRSCMMRVCDMKKQEWEAMDLCVDGMLAVQKDEPGEFVVIPAPQIARWLDEHVAAWDCAE